MTAQPTVDHVDTVSLVSALLTRYPELSSIRSMPTQRTLALTFAVRKRLDRDAQARLVESLEDHVGAFLAMRRDEADVVTVAIEADRAMSFIHVTRDLGSFSNDELDLVVKLFVAQFGDALVRVAAESIGDAEEIAAQHEIAEYAIETLRESRQSKSLVGFREEERVLVYFTTSRKARKASGRR